MLLRGQDEVFIFYIILTYRLILNAGAKLYKYAKHIHVSYGIEQALNVLYICVYIYKPKLFYAWQRNTMNIYVSMREVYKADPDS